jgi:hypothetical protein
MSTFWMSSTLTNPVYLLSRDGKELFDEVAILSTAELPLRVKMLS